MRSRAGLTPKPSARRPPRTPTHDRSASPRPRRPNTSAMTASTPQPSVIQNAKKLVLKVGSSLVTNEGKGIDVEAVRRWARSEEHTSELQSLMRTSYAVFCLKKKNRAEQKTNRSRPSKTIQAHHHESLQKKQ